MVLVVGGAGYIGSHVCRLLRERGVDHLAFDNFSSGHRAALDGTPYLEGDLRRREDLDLAFCTRSIDAVMHFAAHISVGESVRDPAKYYENNTAGVLTLLESMRRHGVRRFIFSSTAAIFGEPKYVPIDEHHPFAPASPYGESKLMVEQMLKAFDHAYGLKSVCLRYFNASGASLDASIGEDHSPEEHLIPVAILAALGKRPPVTIFGDDYPTPDGTCVRDYVHVNDLADAHLLALQHLRADGDSRQYNLGNGQGFSVREVLGMVEAVSGRTVPHRVGPRRPGDPAQLIASSARITQDWGWRPQIANLKDIVASAWRWHAAHPSGYNG